MTIEAIEKIDEMIKRLSMIFQVQTHEVISDLNKLKETLETPVNTVPEKPIKQTKQPKTVKPKVEEKKEETKPEIKEEKSIEDLRKEYKDKFGKNPFMWWSKEVLENKLK